VVRGEVLPQIREVAAAEKCELLDLCQALEGEEEFFPDKVHTSQDGASVIAKTVQHALKQAARPAAKVSPLQPAPTPATR